MDKNFIGRKEELQMLKAIKSSGRAEFVAVYGRRRVGKTYGFMLHSSNNLRTWNTVTSSVAM